MAVTRLGLSGTPRAALKTSTVIVASLASWTWTPLAATVAVDRSVTANLAQWEWTPLQASVSVENSISASLAQWEWTTNAASVSLTRQVTGSLAQWEWTALQADVTVTPTAVDVEANLAQWQWTALRANVSTGQDVAPGGGKSKKRKSKYPRRVSIDGKLYTVKSADEERELLEAYRAKLEREALTLALEDAPKEQVAKAKVKVIRAQRRIEEVEDGAQAWLDHLREEDEIILSAIH